MSHSTCTPGMRTEISQNSSKQLRISLELQLLIRNFNQPCIRRTNVLYLITFCRTMFTCTYMTYVGHVEYYYNFVTKKNIYVAGIRTLPFQYYIVSRLLLPVSYVRGTTPPRANRLQKEKRACNSNTSLPFRW